MMRSESLTAFDDDSGFGECQRANAKDRLISNVAPIRLPRGPARRALFDER